MCGKDACSDNIKIVPRYNIFQQKEHLGADQIDSLIRDMEWKMKTGVGAAGERKFFKSFPNIC